MKHYHFCENVTGKEILVGADTYEEAIEIAKDVVFSVCDCTGYWDHVCDFCLERSWDLEYRGTMSDVEAECSGLDEYYERLRG